MDGKKIFLGAVTIIAVLLVLVIWPLPDTLRQLLSTVVVGAPLVLIPILWAIVRVVGFVCALRAEVAHSNPPPQPRKPRRVSYVPEQTATKSRRRIGNVGG